MGSQPLSLTEAVEEIATWARIIGGKNTNLVDMQALAAFLFPEDRPEWAIKYLTDSKSLCAITQKHLFRAQGCTCYENGPYEPRDGMAVADIENMARRHGIWTAQQKMSKDPTILFGDMFTLGPYNPHTFVVIAKEDGPTPESRPIVKSLDGGQGRGWKILPRAREYDHRRIAMIDTKDGISAAVGLVRTVWGYARMSKFTPEACRSKR